MTTTNDVDTAELTRIAVEAGVILRDYGARKKMIPNKTWGRYAAAVGRIAAATNRPRRDVNDDMTVLVNRALGLPDETGRESRLGLVAAAQVAGLAPETVSGDRAERAVRDPQPTGDVIETYTCRECGKTFQKVRTRGRKPTTCPPCR